MNLDRAQTKSDQLSLESQPLSPADLYHCVAVPYRVNSTHSCSFIYLQMASRPSGLSVTSMVCNHWWISDSEENDDTILRI